nr:unnamed protein product [Callosobruchus analis]
MELVILCASFIDLQGHDWMCALNFSIMPFHKFDSIVVLGDLNCNFLENNNAVLECLSTYGFTQVVE